MLGFILAFISLSLTLIIHELGHFLFARKFKVRVRLKEINAKIKPNIF